PNACFGDSLASIEIVPITAGTYEADWDTGDDGLLLSGLTEGTYSVTVTSDAACEQIYSFTLSDDNPALGTVVDQVQPSCGAANGSLTLQPSGGVGPYTYDWDTGDDQPSIDNLAAGNYEYTITDAVGCTLIGQTDLDEESTTSISSVVVQPTCIGAENGSISLEISNGTPPFTVSWSNGDSGPDVDDLGAGQYTAEVIDANGCTLIREFTLASTSELDLDAMVDNVTCFSGADGVVTTTTTATLPPLSYNWSNNTNEPDLTDVPAGTYTLTITDAANCSYESTYDIEEPDLFIIDSLIDLNDCFGDSAASIQIVPPATGTFTADWNTGDAGLVLADLPSGNYSVVVSSELGCEQAYDFTIDDPNPALSNVPDLTSPTCEEDNGSISLTVSGGQGPYTIDWDNTETGPVLNNLAEGSYQFTVTDGLGCTLVDDVFLAEIEVGSFTSQVNQPTCPGATNGGVELTLSGVAEPFDIQWSNTDNGPVVTDLGEGSISVEIIDANGCILTESYDLEEQSSLSLTSTVADADCFGGNEGSIDLTITATQEPLDFNWSNSGDGPSLDQLEAGTYDLTITDALGCEYESSYEITEPDEFMIDSLITLNDCFGGSDASIEIVPPATGSYNAVWNTTDVGLSLTDLEAGSYSVSITSDLGCVQEYTFELVDEVPPIMVDLDVNDPICGFANGSISATVDGGNGPFDFDWGIAGSGADLTDLSDGDYVLVVTDQAGCTTTIDTSLAPYPELTNSSIVEEPLCAGDATGSISLAPAGGTGPYTYAWSNTTFESQIANVTAGGYEVTITDALGCELIESFTISEPTALQLDQDVVQPLCFGDLGLVVFGPSGGSGTYTLSGDLGDTSLTVNLPSGQYDFELSDANGCSIGGQIDIEAPDQLLSEVVSTIDPDLGVSNGQIMATASGGTEPYTFEWDNGLMGSDINGLDPGTYTATVTDANGCQTTISATLAQPAPLSFLIGSTNNLCAGTCTGTISLQLAGGTEPYTIQWSDGQSGMTATDLCNGQYRAEVIDVNGNSILTDFVTISSPEALSISSSIEPVSCVNIRDGSISTSVLGGTSPYSFSWNGAGGSSDLNNLGAGTYELNVIDGNGCPITQSFIVPDYEVQEFDFSSEVTNCDWDEYEIRILTAGFQDLDWLLNDELVNVGASGSISGISPGSYTLSYREQSGCEVELEDFLFDGLEPYFLLVDESPREVEFGDQLQLEVLASPVDQILNEGTAAWSSINSFSCIDGPPEACQQIELIAEISEVVEFSYRDDRGCLEVFRIPVFVAEPSYVYVPNAFSPNLDGINDELTIFTTDFVRSISGVQIYDRWGNITFENYDLPSGEVQTWDGQVRGQPANSGVYVYMITLELVTGEEVLLSGDVTLVR
ncbi:MAG: gliding motility-associated C-terminal domain-containing protein, partial [Bacteroidota bacterium]